MPKRMRAVRPAPPVRRPPLNVAAGIGVVIGFLAVLSSWCWPVAAPLGVLALVLGSIGKGRVDRGLVRTGATSIGAIVLGALGLVLIWVFLAFIYPALTRALFPQT
jgi:hypothetical protein